METSITIRTKNEEKWLGITLKKLFEQTYRDFEVIIIDSGSSDKTLDIARKFPVKILRIKPERFSYPYSLNYAIARSKAKKYLVIIAAHSVPSSKQWLEDGIADFELDKKIIGVYGTWRALPDASFWDKIIIYFFEWRFILGNPIIYSKPKSGILQFTNAIIKKSFWGKRPFNEDFGYGGEDWEWAKYWMRKGYKIAMEKKFSVYHSHYLSFLGWIKEFIYWKSVGKPRPFKSLTFRKTPNHVLS